MSQEAGSRPIHSQGLLLMAVAVGVLMLAVYLTSNIIESENGGISAAVRTIGVCLAICAPSALVRRPKAGLYIITVEAFSVDFVKKVAVYYGTASMGTIIEVLIVTMLAVVATVLGVLLQSVALRRFKIAPLNWGLLIGSSILGIAVVLASKSTVGFEKAAEDAFNSCFFIALALPITVCLASKEELNKLLRLQFWLSAVWAIWGTKQYFMGFNQLEWFYAETGLSAVASDHLLKGDLRPFGFGSGAPNYGVISPYLVYGVWHFFQYRRRRLLYLLGSLTILVGLVTSLQRTALIFPLLVPIFYYAFLDKRRTIIVYCSAALLFIAGIIASDYLLDHLQDIDDFIAIGGTWGGNVLTVNTYAARLSSWQLLKNPAIYSLFGLNDDFANHDVFSKVIISYGVVGLLATVSAGVTTGWFLHRTLLRIANFEDRKFATFLLAATMPFIFLGLIGGGNFTSNPTNLQIWTFFGAAVSIVIHSKLIVVAPKPSLAALRELLAREKRQPPVNLPAASVGNAPL